MLGEWIHDFVCTCAAWASEDVVRTQWVCAVCPGIQHTKSRCGLNASGLSGVVQVHLCLCAAPSLCAKWWDFSPLVSASPNIVMLRNFSIQMGWWILWINLRMLLSQLVKLFICVWTGTGIMYVEIGCMLWTSHSLCHLSLGNIYSVTKKNLSMIPFSKLMKLFQKALWKCITVLQKLLSCQLATILCCLFILPC